MLIPKHYIIKSSQTDYVASIAAKLFRESRQSKSYDTAKKAAAIFLGAAKQSQHLADRGHCYRRYVSVFLKTNMSQDELCLLKDELNDALNQAETALAQAFDEASDMQQEEIAYELQRLFADKAKFALSFKAGGLLEKSIASFKKIHSDYPNPQFKILFDFYHAKLLFIKGETSKSKAEFQALSDYFSRQDELSPQEGAMQVVVKRKLLQIKFLKYNNRQSLSQEKVKAALVRHGFWDAFDEHRKALQEKPKSQPDFHRFKADLMLILRSKILFLRADITAHYIKGLIIKSNLTHYNKQRLFEITDETIASINQSGQVAFSHRYFHDIEPPSINLSS